MYIPVAYKIILNHNIRNFSTRKNNENQKKY